MDAKYLEWNFKGSVIKKEELVIIDGQEEPWWLFYIPWIYFIQDNGCIDEDISNRIWSFEPIKVGKLYGSATLYFYRCMPRKLIKDILAARLPMLYWLEWWIVMKVHTQGVNVADAKVDVQ